VAVIRDRFVAVGYAEIDLWRGPETKMIDARGKLVLPGFNDGPTCISFRVEQAGSSNLNDAANPQSLRSASWRP